MRCAPQLGDYIKGIIKLKKTVEKEELHEVKAPEFVIESFNSNCLATLKDRLQRTDAWILMAQETGIVESAIGDVAAWAASKG